MDDVLLDLVCDRLDTHVLGGRQTELLLGALAGEEELAGVLAGEDAPVPASDAAAGRSEPVGAYLASLSVAGFRGIGKPATLQLTPGPGLTLVVGRNGSGKSSFAEALELLVTGQLRRLEVHDQVVWKKDWRNLHDGAAPVVEAELVIEGARGKAMLRRRWDADTQLAGGETTVQVDGEPAAGPERLGWEASANTYRPFLSHAELETMLGRPSDLYDLFASVLGLEDLTRASALLADAAKAAEEPLKRSKAALAPMLADLQALDDERARAVTTALGGRKWDLVAAGERAVGATEPSGGGELDVLRRLAQLPGPDLEAAAETADALRSAVVGLESVAGTEAARSKRTADLLEAAVEHHRHDGDGACPVCGRPDALDDEWRSATEGEIARLREEARAAEDAAAAANSARRAALALCTAPPAWLEQLAAAVDTDALLGAWHAWSRAPEAGDIGGLVALAAHLEAAAPPLAAACDAVSVSAASALSEREDRWAPLAVRVAAWCEQAVAAQAQATAAADLKLARQWLVDAIDELRNARLAPIADDATAIWEKLRQESNVEIAGIRLSGTGPARHVDFDLSVDGRAGPGLGVMSQGEVNALALSIFLPRATVSSSPFRFVVIDDPVQAMDPAKVEGLARVLAEVATDRQVVVFTHDDRLPEAARRLRLGAAIVEVLRRPDSLVDVRTTLDPAGRELSDAGALCVDRGVPEALARRVVPGLCRLALEAVLSEMVRRRRLGSGARHADVEEALRVATTLNMKAALALFDDAQRGGDVLRELKRLGGARAADAFQAANKGAHSLYGADLGLLVSDCRALVERLRGQVR